MGWGDAVALGVFVVFAMPLWHIDVREHRLPDRFTVPLCLVEGAVLGVTAAVTDQWDSWGRGLLGAGAMASIYLLLACVPGGVGFGDVKLAPSIGLLAAWWGWDSWLLAIVGAFVSGGIMALWVIVRGASARTHLPFGPAMLLGFALSAALTIAALA